MELALGPYHVAFSCAHQRTPSEQHAVSTFSEALCTRDLELATNVTVGACAAYAVLLVHK